MLLSFCRTVLLYLVLIVVIRLMGKRQIGQMEPTEFVVTMLISNLAAIPMQDGGIPLYSGLVPIVTVLALELILSALCLCSLRLRRLLCGKPVILIDNGRILRENLRRTRVTTDELAELLRQKDILRPEQVQYAILETNGSLTVFPYSKWMPPSAEDLGIRVQKQLLPYTIVADGKLYRENLMLSGRDEIWLEEELHRNGCTLDEVFLLMADDGGQVLCLKTEDVQ